MFKNRLEDNIWKYAIQLITNKRIFVSILSIYYLTVPDVTIQGIGIITAIGTVFGFIFEIPSGYMADKIGHKQTLVLSNALMLLSSTFYFFSNNFITLVAASVLLSVGNAFSSGTGTAFMHETITALGKDKEYVRIMGKVKSVGFALPAVISMLIPFLVVYGYKTPFLVAIIIDLIGLISAISLVIPNVKKERVAELEVGPNNFIRAFREIKHYNLLPGMLFSSIVTSYVFSLGQYRGPYQAVVGVAVIWFGILFGSGRILASIMLWFSGKMHAKISQPNIRLLKIILFTSLSIPLFFTTNKIIVAGCFLLINASFYGLNGLSSGTYRKLKNSSLKATVLSIGAQIKNLFLIVTTPLLGFLIMKYGFKNAYGIFLLSYLIIALYVHIRIKNSTDADDDFGGE